MDRHTLGLAIGGGAVALAVVQKLHQKGILDRSEAREILTAAKRRLAPFLVSVPEAAEAGRAIDAMLAGELSERE